MPTLKRADFLNEQQNRTLDRASAASDPRLAGVRLNVADLDGDGKIRGRAELDKLFTEIDRFDHDGNASTVSLSGQVAGMVAAVRERSVASPPGTPADAAMRAAFPNGFAGESVGPGSPKTKVIAVQYALGRLGHYQSIADGGFGAKSAAATRAFQASKGLTQTGVCDAATLTALDKTVAAIDFRVPAAKASSPLAYLSSFSSLGVSAISIADPARPIGWSHPEVRAAYGKFVGEYWSALKDNRVEADCKTLALFFMDQFRKKLKEDTGIQLPLSRTAQGRVPPSTWVAATADKSAGFFQRTDALATVRPGYDAAKAIEKLDPSQSMLYGVNLRYAGIEADGVARATQTVAAWSPSLSNGGDRTLPEVPIQSLALGDMIFIDHTGDGKYDHTVNVVGIERDAGGKVSKLTLAVGSFDDMNDADATTPPTGLNRINNYCEEVVVRFNAAGRITSSERTWGSEPSYVSNPRYDAHNTLMELRAGGTLKVGRWA